MERFTKLISIYSDITEIAHPLVHIQSASPFTTPTNQYASDVAIQIIAREKWTSERQCMQRLLSSCAANTLAATLCRFVFENYALKKLEAGGRYKCRELAIGNTKKREKTITLPVSTDRCVTVDCVAVGQEERLLHLPLDQNYPSIDAWIPGIGGFQMTVGRDYRINRQFPIDLILLGKGGNNLYFVVPPLQFESFSRQSVPPGSKFKQFALLMPYPDYV